MNTMQNLMSAYTDFLTSLSDSQITRLNESYTSIYACKRGDGSVQFYVTGHNDMGDMMIYDSEGAADWIMPASQFRKQLLDDAEEHLQELAYA